MKKIGLLLFILFIACKINAKSNFQFTVLQWNIWQEGTLIKGGFDAIVNEIDRLRPDFITLS